MTFLLLLLYLINNKKNNQILNFIYNFENLLFNFNLIKKFYCWY